MKVIEISQNPFMERAELLMEFCRKQGIADFVYECKEASGDDFPTALAEAKTQANAIRIGSPFSETIIPTLTDFTNEIQTIGACDFLERERDHWWPRNFLNRAFLKTLSDSVGRVDINHTAFVVGCGAAARSVVAALVRVGFTKVTLTDKFTERGMEAVETLKKKFFQIQFEFAPLQAITTLPGVHSLVVNTTPLVLENDLLDELYFFNFLHEGGVVVDLQLVPSKTPLLLEAETWGARFLSGDFVAAQADALLVHHLTKVQLPVEAYRQELRKKIDAIPFDSSPFLRRFRER